METNLFQSMIGKKGGKISAKIARRIGRTISINIVAIAIALAKLQSIFRLHCFVPFEELELYAGIEGNDIEVHKLPVCIVLHWSGELK